MIEGFCAIEQGGKVFLLTNVQVRVMVVIYQKTQTRNTLWPPKRPTGSRSKCEPWNRHELSASSGSSSMDAERTNHYTAAVCYSFNTLASSLKRGSCPVLRDICLCIRVKDRFCPTSERCSSQCTSASYENDRMLRGRAFLRTTAATAEKKKTLI